MTVQCKVLPVVLICSILWHGTRVGIQPASGESIATLQSQKTETTGAETHAGSIQPSSSAKFSDLTLSLSSEYSLTSSKTDEAGTNVPQLTSSMITTTQEITLAPSSTMTGFIPTLSSSLSVIQPSSEATSSFLSGILSSTSGQPTSASATADASMSPTAHSMSSAQSLSLSPSETEIGPTETNQLETVTSLSQGIPTYGIQPTSTSWEGVYETISLNPTMVDTVTDSESISLSSAHSNQISISSSSEAQSVYSQTPSPSAAIIVKPTAAATTTVTQSATLAPPTKPSGSGASAGEEESKEDEEEEPNKKATSSESLSSGAKTAIGVIVTLCVLAVIIGGITLYRRYNITHRSLKTFLTSGVRYKTYNNATYKDDEGMLIMPDRR